MGVVVLDADSRVCVFWQRHRKDMASKERPAKIFSAIATATATNEFSTDASARYKRTAASAKHNGVYDASGKRHRTHDKTSWRRSSDENFQRQKLRVIFIRG
jgi:hypothetical protein